MSVSIQRLFFSHTRSNFNVCLFYVLKVHNAEREQHNSKETTK